MSTDFGAVAGHALVRVARPASTGLPSEALAEDWP
jgi:hypothetical protein